MVTMIWSWLSKPAWTWTGRLPDTRPLTPVISHYYNLQHINPSKINPWINHTHAEKAVDLNSMHSTSNIVFVLLFKFTQLIIFPLHHHSDHHIHDLHLKAIKTCALSLLVSDEPGDLTDILDIITIKINRINKKGHIFKHINWKVKMTWNESEKDATKTQSSWDCNWQAAR